MPKQQLNESYKCVESVKALDSDTGHHLAGLRQCSIAQVNTHLGTETEEACYQVVGLQNALEMHLSNNIIQMTHDGECDMLKYICPEVEMSTRGRNPSVNISTSTFNCMSHESIMHHLFCRITN